ncbi:MAG: GNAT family N-acetyltransferase [Terracidiphilus sp.]|jgi:predicted acetyltransferase
MPSAPESPSVDIELLPAKPEQEILLRNLLELYIHDFSQFVPLEPGPDGRFGYPNLSLYWSDPDRYPFLVYAGGKLAGFAFAKRESASASARPVWDLAEFFILRAHRRRKIGLQAALQLWKKFPGPWQVRVMQSNHPACAFWQTVIHSFTGTPIDPVTIENQGQKWNVFLFQSTPAVEE